MSAASKRHMGRVAGLPCATCGAHGVHVHHIKEGASGAGERAGDFLTIPLCPACHTGPKGVHGDKTMLRITKKSQHDLLDETLEALYGK
jgi:predicted HNH restriction endonuclease